MGLDQLLARGNAILSREARERAAKHAEEELDSVRAKRMRMAQLQAERFEWKPIAAAVLFEVQTCANCGQKHTFFRGFGTILQRKADFLERWAAADCLDRGLPFQRRQIETAAPTCALCFMDFCTEPPPAPYEFHPDRKGE